MLCFQRELQELVVERYRNKCEGAFSELENDGYVFKHLIGHIIASGTEIVRSLKRPHGRSVLCLAI